MKALNSKGAPSFAHLPGKHALSPARMATLLADDSFTLVDLRRPEAFGGSHIPGALNLGAGQNVSLWAGWMISPEKKLLLVNDKGDDEEARRSLARVGLDQIEGFLQGGMPAWIGAGMDVTRTTQLSTKEVAEREPGTQILDVRSDRQWNSGHIQGAIHIPLGDLERRIGELPREHEIQIVCGSGYRSSIAASLLQANGFTKIGSMDGGMTAWKKRQLPITAN
jgi:hydroxyacylglutathione hydrolase